MAQGTFPLQPGTRPIDRAPCRTSPCVQKQIDDQVDKFLKQGIIEGRTSAWGITVADAKSAFHQLPVADSDVESTAFVTAKGKYCFKRVPVGVCIAPWLYQRMMSLALGDTGFYSVIWMI